MAAMVWAVFVAAIMPVALTAIAKAGAFGPSDNRRTRDWQATLTGWRQRAHWAHQNAFEAFPAFAAAVLMVLVVAPDHAIAPFVAWAFIGARVAYSVCYIKDWAAARSLVWTAGLGCVAALFVMAAVRASS